MRKYKWRFDASVIDFTDQKMFLKVYSKSEQVIGVKNFFQLEDLTKQS